MILRMICRHCKHDEFKIFTTVPEGMEVKAGETINPEGKEIIPVEYGELQCIKCGEIATINRINVG